MKLENGMIAAIKKFKKMKLGEAHTVQALEQSKDKIVFEIIYMAAPDYRNQCSSVIEVITSKNGGKI